MNPKKLVLHFSDFSMISYVIYKKQQEHFYYFRSTLRQGPWKERESYPNAPGLHSGPQKEYVFRNVTLGWPAGAEEQNPASSPVLAVGEGREKGLRPTRGSVWGSIGGVGLPASPPGGAAVRRPRRLGVRDEGGTAGPTSNTGSTNEC
jgi:hypothetical protein